MTEEQVALFGFLFIETGAIPGPIQDTAILEQRLQAIIDVMTDDGKKALLDLFRTKIVAGLAEKKVRLEKELSDLTEQIDIAQISVIDITKGP
jgi:hypothetical protein